MTRSIFVCYSLLLLLYIYKDIKAQFHTNLDIKKFELCNNTQGLVKFFGNITKQNGVHYMDFTVVFPIPIDDNIGVIVWIDSAPNSKSFLPLFVIREKSACKAANIYMREFWYDICRAAQITPGVCPIRVGRYHASHVPLRFNQIALQTFPFGRLKFIIKTTDHRNPGITMSCFVVEVEDQPNLCVDHVINPKIIDI